jgi:glutaminyl-peptide cyclotransferase
MRGFRKQGAGMGHGARAKGLLLLALLTVLALGGCHRGSTRARKEPSKEKSLTSVPAFSADSAYSYVQKQLEFGPRVPGTPAQEACSAWLAGKFRSFGADVIVQKAEVKVYDGKMVPMRNIIARIEPENNNRILLMAHWDTRPFADQDPDPALRDKPIPGANDGASGVGVLLELARDLQGKSTPLGIDLVLFDVEDYGAPEGEDNEGTTDDWCLGSQYWARHPHISGYFARYGILLDMIGASDATFSQEEVSRYYAQSVLDKVWTEAHKLGYSKYFTFQQTPQLIDDHRYVNEITGIPCIDIIHYDPTTTSGFPSYWHTHQDDIGHVSRKTLTAVGNTLLNVIFNEKL